MIQIAIVTGGYTGENAISRKSAQMVVNNIDREKYEPFLIDISKKGWFCLMDSHKIPVDKNDFSVVFRQSKISFDAVCLALHGSPGEDGLLQSYFEMIGLPFTTGPAFNAFLTFNKFSTIQMLKAGGLPVTESVLIRKGSDYNINKIIEETGLPCFVKPNFGGSSLGMSKVKEAHELENAIQLAFEESDEVMIEAFMAGREFTCGVLQTGKEIKPIAVTEIISKNEFFDYESKYDPALADEITPAPINPEEYDECMQLSVKAFEWTGCKGMARVDFILTDEGFKIIEINTIPGLTEVSIFPKMAEFADISKKEMISILLENVI
jgi:D-alanine-D-alanine ligase